MAINPKYRRLTSEELSELEKEFVDYLVVNGIVADEWERIKELDLDKAEDIVTLFSDVVLEGVLRKTKFIEYRGKGTLNAFQCLEEKMILVGLEAPDFFDFSDEQLLKEAITMPPDGLKLVSSEKNYIKSREQEIFHLLDSGCEISDGSMFKTLQLALANKINP